MTLNADELIALRRVRDFLKDAGIGNGDDAVLAGERRVLAKLIARFEPGLASSYKTEPSGAREITITSGNVHVGDRCARCHRTAPNSDGCAHCNPVRLGERLREALAELSLIKRHKRFYVLVRIRVSKVSRDGAPARDVYTPVWWTIDDHDGTNHAVADGHYTINLCSIDAPTIEDAHAQFQAGYPFYAPLLKSINATTPVDWGGKLDAEQRDEMMAGFYMDRLDARKHGKPMPEEPRMNRTAFSVGQRVRFGLQLDALVTVVEKTDVLRLKIQPIKDFPPDERSAFWIDASEILGAIALHQTAVTCD